MISFAYIQSNIPLIVCDTNVWYWIAEGKFIKPKSIELTPTSLSIMELSTSEVMAHETSLYQKVIQSIYKNGSSIIALNAFDFVLNNHDPSYRGDDTPTINVLGDITEILKRDISDDVKLDFELKEKILTACKESRKSTYDFAEFSTKKLTEIRKNINNGVGKNNHLNEDTTEKVKMTNT